MSLPKMGAPIQLLFEGEGHVVTVELKNGDTYRGVLQEAEETMNCQLKDVTMTAREGRVQRLEHVFLRGGNIKFIVMPDILKNAPIFKKVNSMRASKVKDDGASRRSKRGWSSKYCLHKRCTRCKIMHNKAIFRKKRLSKTLFTRDNTILFSSFNNTSSTLPELSPF